MLEKGKINVLWMHHFVNQKEAKNLASKDFINKIDWIVYNSNWNLDQHIRYFHVPKETAKIINKARAHKKSICVVGTSTVRTLETVVVSGFQITSRNGWTDKFIYPPYDFKMCDKFITNFHQPQSTLMMLTAAFAKKDFILKAYKEAIKKKYRFYSYGDSMIII